MTTVKFCGMTRVEDVEKAAELGAAFVGVVLTASPRRVTPQVAATILAAVAGADLRAVGVFGAESIDDILASARVAGIDIVQLHGPRSPDEYAMLRTTLGAESWRVVRVGTNGLSDADRIAFEEGDATLLDTMSGSVLGGTGHAFDWDETARQVAPLRGKRRLILAGGLRPGNVRRAIETLVPDVVDVSSGIERAPGVKDHELMADFMAAAVGART